MSYNIQYLFGHFGLAVPAVFPPHLLPNPRLQAIAGAIGDSLNAVPALLSNWCDINTVLATHAKHHVIWDAVREVNSIPD